MLVLIREVETGRIPRTTTTVEQITTGVVAVDWSVEADADVRLHLLIGDGTKPPVDLGFEPSSGRLSSVQLILQDEAVEPASIFPSDLPAVAGIASADISAWRGTELILDHVYAPATALEPDGAVAVRVGRSDTQPARRCVLPGLDLVLDGEELVLGCRFTALSPDDLGRLEAAAASGSDY